MFKTQDLTSASTLVFSKVIESIDSDVNNTFRGGLFSNGMKTAHVIIRVNNGLITTTLQQKTINQDEILNFYLAKGTIGQTLEVWAYTSDVNRGSMTFTIQKLSINTQSNFYNYLVDLRLLVNSFFKLSRLFLLMLSKPFYFYRTK